MKLLVAAVEAELRVELGEKVELNKPVEESEDETADDERKFELEEIEDEAKVLELIKVEEAAVEEIELETAEDENKSEELAIIEDEICAELETALYEIPVE